ncbi:MAG TPA: translation initiation factor IF-2 [Pseudomonadota bacterium]|nr:translation initiation factor IF-2 [Pseudomonadota bacterium]
MNTESVGTAGSKVAVYELAKELGMPQKDLVEKIRALGIDAKNHMSRLERDEVDRVRRAFEKERHENTVQERVNDTVIRRRAKDGSRLHPEAQHVPVVPPVPEFRPTASVAPTEPVKRVVRVVNPGGAVSAGQVAAEPKPVVSAPKVASSATHSGPQTGPGPEPKKDAEKLPAAKVEAAPKAKGVETVPRPVLSVSSPPIAETPPVAEVRPAQMPEAKKDLAAKDERPREPSAKKDESGKKTARAKAAELAPVVPTTTDAPGRDSVPVVQTPVTGAAVAAKSESATPAVVTKAVEPRTKPKVAEPEAPVAEAVPTKAAPDAATQTDSKPVQAARPAKTETVQGPTVHTAKEPERAAVAESKPVSAKPVLAKPAETEPAAKQAKPEAERVRVMQIPASKSPLRVEKGTKPQPERSTEAAGADRRGVAAPAVPSEPNRVSAHGTPSSVSTPVSAPAKVFVTAQTRRSLEGLGPTGRVIDLSAFKPQPAAKPAPSSESPRHVRADQRDRGDQRTEVPVEPSVGRGPRQEVSGERLRGTQESRRAPVGPSQPTKGKLPPGRKPGKTQITTAAEHKRVVKMGETIVIAELSRQMAQKATDVLKKIWELGMRNVMINSPIDFDTAQLVATEFEWRVESTAFQEQSVVNEVTDKPEDLKPRAPVITIMGHVDHGKTSLLDAIRNANVAAGEAGGITQHIGAYRVTSQAGDVVFLDTPGHEAFTEMRARGAQVTDIVVLVVAADDGIMPQTVEALNHARDAKVPIIVAVNKIDKPGAQPDRIRQQLASHGLNPEEWGGETIFCDVSARTKVGVDKLLEMLALQSEVLELRANPNKAAKGVVIEARMDARRGPVATVLVQDGMLRMGDTVVVGEEMGKVRAMSDDKGRTLSQAGPSMPVELLGLSGVPRAGEVLNAVADERAAKELVEHRRQRRIDRDRAKAGPVSLDKLMDAMKAGLKDLKVILKADVQGSVEALGSALGKLSTKDVKVTVIQSGVGGITESDVNLAKAGNAIIIGFHVRPAGKAANLAEQESVDIKLYDIIYDAIDDVKLAMAGLLAPVKREKLLGKAEVREIFNIPKVGVVAGCSVSEGTIKRSALARLVRDSVLIYSGKLGSLRRFKDDVREVQQGYECGMSIEGYLDIKVGDVIESYEVEEIAPTLA